LKHLKKSGQYTSGENGLDLFMAEPKKWVCIFHQPEDEYTYTSPDYFETFDEAEKSGKESLYYITSINVRK